MQPEKARTAGRDHSSPVKSAELMSEEGDLTMSVQPTPKIVDANNTQGLNDSVKIFLQRVESIVRSEDFRSKMSDESDDDLNDELEYLYQVEKELRDEMECFDLPFEDNNNESSLGETRDTGLNNAEYVSNNSMTSSYSTTLPENVIEATKIQRDGKRDHAGKREIYSSWRQIFSSFSSERGLAPLAESYEILADANSAPQNDTHTRMALSDQKERSVEGQPSREEENFSPSQSLIQAASDVDRAEKELASFLHSEQVSRNMDHGDSSNIFSSQQGLPSPAESRVADGILDELSRDEKKTTHNDETHHSMAVSDHKVTFIKRRPKLERDSFSPSRSIIQIASDVDRAEKELASFLNSQKSGDAVQPVLLGRHRSASIIGDLEKLSKSVRDLRAEMKKATGSYQGTFVLDEVPPTIQEISPEMSESKDKSISSPQSRDLQHLSSDFYDDAPKSQKILECLLSRLLCRSRHRRGKT
uniref:Uncharacterized protein n=1 Tax=Ditylum brightwellii TaxID=49249 RepID=A0A7S4WB28_9STRA